jgi:hypothetical protein
MRLQLQSIHFGGGPVMNGGGQLILRCTAQIGNLYQEYVEKELGVPQKDPIPARGKVEVTNFIRDLLNFFSSLLFPQSPRQLPWMQHHPHFSYFSQLLSH